MGKPFFLRVAMIGIFLCQGSFCWASSGNRFQEALRILNQLPVGRFLLQKALKTWKRKDVFSLQEFFRWGETSRTDTVLTRKFNPKTGKEDRERQVTIYLKEDQSISEVVLDLSHELVHATSQPSWDPYDPMLTPGKYILAAIEGEGGEVDAVTTECQISLEIHQQSQEAIRRCENYVSLHSHEISSEKVRQDFYRVGKWKSEIIQLLGSEIRLFPFLSSETPKLYSSTGHSPYPIALIHEFEEITQVACKNSLKRMDSIAPEETSLLQPNLENFILKRCR
jgi:hypothetical protein